MGRDQRAASAGGFVDQGDRPPAGAWPGKRCSRRCWIRAAARYARPLGGSKVDVFVPAIRELRTVFPDMPASVTAERVGWQFSASALRARSPSQGCCTARVIRQTHEQLRSGCPGQLAGSVGPGTSVG